MKSSVECGNDELFSIFQFLDPQSILNSCVRVSQRWKQVACCNALWKYFCNSILMNDVFEWDLDLERCNRMKALHNSDHDEEWNHHLDEKNQLYINSDPIGRRNDEYYWYNVFQALFRIPIIKSFSFMDRERQMRYAWAELLERFDFHVPRLSEPFDLEYPEVDERVDCPTDNEHNPRKFPSIYEHGQEERIFQHGWKYVYAKIATLLAILSSGSHCTPNPWNDKIILTCFEYQDQNSNWQVKKTTSISVAAFCVAQMFPKSGPTKLRELVSAHNNNCRMSISPNIEDANHVKPFCFFEYMDKFFVKVPAEDHNTDAKDNERIPAEDNITDEEDNERSEDVENAIHGGGREDDLGARPMYRWYDYVDDSCERFLWLPMVFNAGGCVRTYKYDALYLGEQNLLRVEKHYELDY
ncbi:hypothetical protein C9374_012239 [Naegleria lovaniensis]|uniref:F-box domain-containing protein n=1 Tax=Naegleria lovaniensis TaxID=51637 RepID=A0AA88GDB3_NAELO|nr:uncharacterized protein C9374_012239 [Naegleria lovaniensis]KAG2373373.1 hypothetical protein C9374_012239 [Naegleria lovaniensis]